MRTAPLAILVAMAVAVTATSALAETKPAATKPAVAPAAPAAKTAAPANPAAPLLVLESKDWKAITANGGKGKMCFALSKPQKMDPPTLNHGEVDFFISTRPTENVRNEPSLQVGYPLKEGSKVIVDIDGRKFTFFTRGDGAWLENNADYNPLFDSLKKGKKMAVTGTSGRGNPTNYAFSLAGVGAALDAAAKECK